jgi:hypothetical protein
MVLLFSAMDIKKEAPGIPEKPPGLQVAVPSSYRIKRPD